MTIREQKDNLFLYSFMKNNEDWNTEFDEITKRVRYYNPLNASYLGLLFCTDKAWLDAVGQKIVKWIDETDEEFMLYCDKKENNEFCFQAYINKELICHVHHKKYIKGYREILVGIVEYLTYKYN